MKYRWSAVVIAVAFFLAGIFFAAGADIFGSNFSRSTHAESPAAVPTIQTVEDLEVAFSTVAEAVNPAVVQVLSTRMVQRQPFPDFFEGTPFERFFRGPGEEAPREEPRQGLGSGVILRADGYIVTNNHVIHEVDEIEVRLYDGRRFAAEVIGTDPNSDLAVIRIDANNLPTVPYADANNIRVGQWVLAVGSPLSEDLGNTVTAGIVSALGRVSASLSQLNLFASFLQTDAAINPGNSGGALVNLRGQLVGINTAIATRTGFYHGVGFAIPVDVVQNVADQLIETGAVRRGYLGLTFNPVSESLARTLEVPRGSAQVTEVVEGAAAERAGLRQGDVIVTVNGVQLRDANELRTIVGNMLPGQQVELGIVRDGRERTLNVTLGERPGDEELAGSQPAAPRGERPAPASFEAAGIEVATMTPQLAQRFRIEDRDAGGVVVTSVDRTSEAWRDAEIRPGMRVVEVNRQQVTSVEEFRATYDAVPEGQSFLVRLQRPDGTSFLTALTKR